MYSLQLQRTIREVYDNDPIIRYDDVRFFVILNQAGFAWYFSYFAERSSICYVKNMLKEIKKEKQCVETIASTSQIIT